MGPKKALTVPCVVIFRIYIALAFVTKHFAWYHNLDLLTLTLKFNLLLKNFERCYLMTCLCSNCWDQISSNLPCLYSTFHLEYPLVLSRVCLMIFFFFSNCDSFLSDTTPAHGEQTAKNLYLHHGCYLASVDFFLQLLIEIQKCSIF